MGEYLLEVQDLKTYFKVKAGRVRAVDGVSFSVRPGERVGLVGESGCGKSVTALSIMRLLPKSASEQAGGSILFDDEDLLTRISDLARLHNRSVEEEIKALLNTALPAPYVHREDLRALANTIAAATPKGVKQTDSLKILRAHRDGTAIEE